MSYIGDFGFCPKCQGALDTVDSRAGRSYRQRRRKCRECKYKFSTIEVYADDWKALNENVRLAAEMARLSANLEAMRHEKLP